MCHKFSNYFLIFKNFQEGPPKKRMCLQPEAEEEAGTSTAVEEPPEVRYSAQLAALNDQLPGEMYGGQGKRLKGGKFCSIKNHFYFS